MIEYKTLDGVATLTIGGEPGHPMNEALIDALRAAIADYAADENAEVAVLTAEGDTFSMGADLGTLGSLFNSDAGRLVTEALDALDKPVVAALRGAVFGTALEIALACDWRIATRDAAFALPAFAIGLPPAAGATQRLPGLTGIEAALDLLLGNTPVGAVRALESGLIDSVLEQVDDRFETGFLVQAQRFAREMPRSRRPRATLSDTGRVAAIAHTGQALDIQRTRHSTEGAAVCIAVTTGLRDGWDAGYGAELDGYLQCENSPRHQAIRNARRMREEVEVRGIDATEGHAGLRRVVVTGALPTDWRQPDDVPVVHADSAQAWPDDLGASDALVVCGPLSARSLQSLAMRAPQTSVLYVEPVHLSFDVDARASLPQNIAFGMTYGATDAPVLQLVASPGSAGFAQRRAVELARAFGALCLHATAVPLGPTVWLKFEDLLFALAHGGVPAGSIHEALAALGLPTVDFGTLPSMVTASTEAEMTDERLRFVLLCGLLNVCAGLLDSRDAQHPDDLDTVLCYGFHVPPESLPFGWGARVPGVRRAYSELVDLACAYGETFAPGRLLTNIGKVDAA